MNPPSRESRSEGSSVPSHWDSAMRGPSFLVLWFALLYGQSSSSLNEKFGGSRETFPTEAANVTVRIGVIFTKEDIESGENLVFQVGARHQLSFDQASDHQGSLSLADGHFPA